MGFTLALTLALSLGEREGIGAASRIRDLGIAAALLALASSGNG